MEKRQKHPKQLVDTWIDFTKGLALYPPTNARVGKLRTEVLAELRPWFEDGGPIALRVQREAIHVGGTSIPSEQFRAHGWILERLDRVRLEGIIFTPQVDDVALTAFTQYFLLLTTRTQAIEDFEEYWSDPFPGIEVLERTFHDSFRGRGKFSEPQQFTEADEAILRVLGDDEDFLQKVQSIADGISTQIEGADYSTDVAMDGQLLTQIADLIPAEAFQDESRIKSYVYEALETLETSIEEQEASGTTDQELDALMFAVGRKYFSATTKPKLGTRLSKEPRSAPAGQTAQNRAKEAQVLPDVSELLEEYESLPEEDISLCSGSSDLIGEQVGVLLYFLFHLEDESAVPNLQRRLRDAIKESPHAAAILQRTLLEDECLLRSSDPKQENDRLFSFLGDAGLLRLAMDCGFLDRDRVLRSFPNLFLPFLDELDFEEGPGHAILDSLCRSLGEKMLLAAREAFEKQGGFSKAERQRHILESPSLERLPLVRMILEESPERSAKPVRAFLRSLGLQGPEAGLLHIEDSLLPVPTEYLIALTISDRSNEQQRRLVQYVGRQLCEYLDRTAFDKERSSQRLQALSRLRSIHTKQVRETLERIGRQGRRFGLVKEDPKLREAAERLLITHRGN